MSEKKEAEMFHGLAFTEKSNYLKFICDIGKNGLEEKFKFPGEDISLWWFSRIVEKSPLKSDSYRDLISFLATGGSKKTRKAIGVRIRESLPAQFIAGLFRICEFIIRVIYVKMATKDFRSRENILADQDFYIFSYFPLINEDLAQKGIFENAYIGPFHRALEEKFTGRYSHIFYQVDINGRGLKESVKLANRFAESQSVFFMEEFVKPYHIMLLVLYYLYFSVLFMLNIGRLKKGILYEHNGRSYDVWRIFKADFFRSFCGPSLASSIRHILLFSELVGQLNNKGKIVCICEMQWWERALYAFAKKRGIATVGVQHTIVPELLLNYFNDPREISGADKIKRCPLPDHMATVGDTSSDIFIKGGWPPERVFTWGAQRFESLRGMSDAIVPWSSKENYFVCIFSVNIADSGRLLSLIKDAFSGVKDYKIIIRGHPAADIRSQMKRMKLQLDESVFEYTDRPLHDIARKAKGIILVSSSSCLYALACDIPVMVPLFTDRIDYNPLSYITDIPIYTYSAKDLRSACDRIAAAATSPCRPDTNSECLRSYLYFPKDQGEYLEKITSL